MSGYLRRFIGVILVFINVLAYGAPSAPAGATASEIGVTGFTLSWDASSVSGNPVSFLVYSGTTLLGTPAGSPFAVAGLKPATQYSITIKAKDAKGLVSPASVPLLVSSIADTTAPSKPTDLVASNVTEKSFTLSWSPSTDDVKVTGYSVFSSGKLVGTVSSSTRAIAGLSASINYTYTVRAKDAAGNLSLESDPLVVRTLDDLDPPSTPGNPSAANVLASSFTFSWAASTDNVKIAGYEISKDGVVLVTTTALTRAITGLVPQTSYSFTVRAKDPSGNFSAPSSAVVIQTTADVTPPTQPTGLTASTVGAGSFLLKWNPSKDDVKVAAYDIFKNGVLLSSTASTSKSITALFPLTEYRMRVNARDAAGNVSQSSEEIGVTTLADTTSPVTPAAPRASSITPVSLKLTWTAVKDDVAVDHYNVYQDGALNRVAGTPSVLVSGLVPQTTYGFAVSASDATGNESPTGPVLSVTTTADVTRPSTPAGLTASEILNRSAKLSWNTSTDNVGVTGYKVFNKGVLFASTPGSAFAAEGLVPATYYAFTVKAVDAAGNLSNASNAASFTTLAYLNAPPVCQIAAPTDDAVVTVQDALPFSISGSDSDGYVARTELFANLAKLSESASGALDFTWVPSVPGKFQVLAKATDNSGASANSLIRNVRVLPSANAYSSDFESAHGYSLGSLNDQLGWVVNSGSAEVVASANSTRQLLLHVSDIPASVEQEFGPAANNPSVVYVDFLGKPLAGDDPSSATFLELDSAQLCFVLNGNIGQFHVLDGDGSGAGTWHAIRQPFTLDASGRVSDKWIRVTARIDYGHKTYDIYLDGKLAVSDLKFRLQAAGYFSWLSFKGSNLGDVNIDELYVGSSNPLFQDSDNDGLSDSWELAHGLSPNFDDRNQDIDGDGLSNAIEFALGTDPRASDSDGDGVSDGIEFSIHSDPTVAQSAGVVYAGEQPLFHFRSDIGAELGVDGRIAAWHDVSGNKLHALYERSDPGPSVLADALNQRPSVVFDGPGFHMPKAFAGCTQGNIFAVVKITPVQDQYQLFWGFGTTIGTGTYNSEFVDDFGTSGFNDHQAYSEHTQYHIFEISLTSDGRLTERVNGKVFWETTGKTVGFPNEGWLGTGFHGEICEVLGYDHVLDAAGRKAATQYLAQRFLPGLIVPPPTPSLNGFVGDDTSVDLSWQVPAFVGEVSVDLQKSSDGLNFVAVEHAAEGARVTLVGLEPATDLYVRARASGTFGVSEWSPTLKLHTLSAGSRPIESGLRLHLRSSTEAPGPIAKWTDLSPSAVHGFQSDGAYQPSVVLEKLNGYPAVTFPTGTENVVFADAMSSATQGEIVAVVRTIPQSDVNNTLWHFGVSPHGTGLLNGMMYDDFGSNDPDWHNAPQGVEQFGIWDVSASPDKFTERYNGAVNWEHSLATVTFPTTQSLGGFKGDVVEVLVYDRALSPAERNTNALYLVNKYKLTIASLTSPNPPTGLSASNITDSSVDISWIPPVDGPSIASYNLLVNGRVYQSTVGTSTPLSGLLPLTSYAISVVSITSDAHVSLPSAPLTVQTLQDATAPTLPTNLSAYDVSDTTFSVYWGESSDLSRPISYGVVLNGVEVAKVTANSYVFSNLTRSTTYQVAIYAEDVFQNASTQTAPISVTTLGDIHAPTAPTNLVATNVGITSFNLAWLPSTDDVGVVGYDVFVNGELKESNVSSPVAIAGCRAGLFANVTVVARDATGNSASSGTLIVQLKGDTNAPGAPSNLRFTNLTSSSVDLTWDAATDSEGQVDYIAYNGAGTSVAETNALTVHLDQLAPNTRYSFRLSARDGGGNLSEPISVEFTTPAVSNMGDIRGLRLWLQSGQGVHVIEGTQNLSSWDDASNAHFAVVPAAENVLPVVQMPGLSGIPTIRVAPSTRLSVDGGFGTLKTGTVVCLLMLDADPGSTRQSFWSFSQGANTSGIVGGNRSVGFGNISSISFPIQPSTGKFTLIEESLSDAGELIVRQDGQVLWHGIVGDAAFPSVFSFGGFSGEIAELAIYDRTISSEERYRLLLGLKNTYPNLDTSTFDYDGDGVIDFTVATSPTVSMSGDAYPADYYNQSKPLLTIVSGDLQVANPGGFLAEPIVVKIQTVSGTPLRNAPVQFEIVGGAGGLSSRSNSSTLSTRVQLLTDSEGKASVSWWIAPGASFNPVDLLYVSPYTGALNNAGQAPNGVFVAPVGSAVAATGPVGDGLSASAGNSGTPTSPLKIDYVPIQLQADADSYSAVPIPIKVANRGNVLIRYSVDLTPVSPDFGGTASNPPIVDSAHAAGYRWAAGVVTPLMGPAGMYNDFTAMKLVDINERGDVLGNFSPYGRGLRPAIWRQSPYAQVLNGSPFDGNVRVDSISTDSVIPIYPGDVFSRFQGGGQHKILACIGGEVTYAEAFYSGRSSLLYHAFGLSSDGSVIGRGQGGAENAPNFYCQTIAIYTSPYYEIGRPTIGLDTAINDLNTFYPGWTNVIDVDYAKGHFRGGDPVFPTTNVKYLAGSTTASSRFTPPTLSPAWASLMKWDSASTFAHPVSNAGGGESSSNLYYGSTDGNHRMTRNSSTVFLDGSVLGSGAFGPINNLGRYVSGSSWGEGSTLNSIAGLGSRTLLAINNHNHILDSQNALWLWGTDGVYHEATANLNLPTGTSLVSLAPSISDEGMLVGRVNYPKAPGLPTLFVPGGIYVDANRDGVISANTSDDVTSKEKPFRFWVNDDDDDGGDINGEDIPGSSTPDGKQVKVQGTRDLVDFFPVYLDIKALLAALPPSSSVQYKLKNADDGLRFVYTDLKREDAFKFLKDFATGNSLKEADAHWTTAAGYGLDSVWLGKVRDEDKGVILVEGRIDTDKPLVLSVEKSDGTVIAEVKLELKIVPVETMFRHLNLHERNLAEVVGSMPGGAAQPEAMGSPAGFPDEPNSDSRWLIFVHGFNVSGQGSRGWNAEMFKRCYWSGNNARFVGVSWFGNPDQVFGALSDYHLAMRNAMVTAPVLAQEINALPGGAINKTIFAHSLGCGVISSAIADYGMNIGRVCFVDAALARECFDGRDPNTYTAENDGMTPANWKAYDPKLYAANWHALFDPATDARGLLTWADRFTRTTNGQKDVSSFVYNFYSSTEDVLAAYPGEVPTSIFGLEDLHGSFGWVWQEKGKGNRQDYGFGATHLGSLYAGWGFNLTDPQNTEVDRIYYWLNGVGGRLPLAPNQIPDASTEAGKALFRRLPLFDPGFGQNTGVLHGYDPSILRGPAWLPALFDATTGSATAAIPARRAQLLAEAIPALTWCLGSRSASRFEDRNFNLPSLIDQTNWPRDRINNEREWRHSDIREVAYLYQYGVFDKIISISKP